MPLAAEVLREIGSLDESIPTKERLAVHLAELEAEEGKAGEHPLPLAPTEIAPRQVKLLIQSEWSMS